MSGELQASQHFQKTWGESELGTVGRKINAEWQKKADLHHESKGKHPGITGLCSLFSPCSLMEQLLYKGIAKRTERNQAFKMCGLRRLCPQM